MDIIPICIFTKKCLKKELTELQNTQTSKKAILIKEEILKTIEIIESNTTSTDSILFYSMYRWILTGIKYSELDILIFDKLEKLLSQLETFSTNEFFSNPSNIDKLLLYDQALDYSKESGFLSAEEINKCELYQERIKLLWKENTYNKNVLWNVA